MGPRPYSDSANVKMKRSAHMQNNYNGRCKNREEIAVAAAECRLPPKSVFATPPPPQRADRTASSRREGALWREAPNLRPITIAL
mmetsp:Transcript_17053/g.27252  ORF Transcript_17053/g.27252 Transcript_17053/m.27252 type:complete len:85 (+) Transcript_17053:1050-1304(+)